MIDIRNCDMFDEKDGLASLNKGDVNAIITDFPYGTLNKRNGWDKVIDYEVFWKHCKNFLHDTSPVISTAQMPFTAYLISTNYNDFKYTMVWEKSKATGYLNAKKQPMRAHEDIVVFYKKQCTYNPQMTIYTGKDKSNIPKASIGELCGGKKGIPYVDNGTRYPLQVLKINRDNLLARLHPTQKPLELMEYLVKTFTNEGDTVLDFTMGSGTTGVACKNLNRNFIGIELDENYYKIAKERIYGKEEESS